MESNLLVGFLDRNRLQLYGGSLAAPIALDFSPSAVRDVEVVNALELENEIKAWLAAHKIGTVSLVIVLADATYFAHMVTKDDLAKQEAETQAFVDAVPFEEIQIKHYVLDGKQVVIAVNKDFLEIFQHIFGLVGVSIVSIVPELLLGAFGGNQWLDEAMGRYVLAHAESLISQSIMETQSSLGSRGSPSTKLAGINRLFLLLGTFVLLIIILVLLLLLQ